MQLQRVVVILRASQIVAGHLVWSRLAATAAELQLPALRIDSDSARVRLLHDMHESMHACQEHARPETRHVARLSWPPAAQGQRELQAGNHVNKTHSARSAHTPRLRLSLSTIIASQTGTQSTCC